jgi:hypothetical protein
MSTQEPLRLSHGFELAHFSLPNPGRLIPDKAGQALRLFRSIILILLGTVDRLGHQLPMSDPIAA